MIDLEITDLYHITTRDVSVLVWEAAHLSLPCVFCLMLCDIRIASVLHNVCACSFMNEICVQACVTVLWGYLSYLLPFVQ